MPCYNQDGSEFLPLRIAHKWRIHAPAIMRHIKKLKKTPFLFQNKGSTFPCKSTSDWMWWL